RAARGEHPRRSPDPRARRRQARRRRHPRAARADLPDLRRDRDVAERGQGGGRVSTNRPAPAAQRSGGPPLRGPFGAGMAPPQKAKNFRGSARRLLGLLGPQRKSIAIVIALAVGSVSLQIAGPVLLARATNLIYGGFLGAKLDPSMTHEQAVAAARASGNAVM